MDGARSMCGGCAGCRGGGLREAESRERAQQADGLRTASGSAATATPVRSQTSRATKPSVPTLSPAPPIRHWHRRRHRNSGPGAGQKNGCGGFFLLCASVIPCRTRTASLLRFVGCSGSSLSLDAEVTRHCCCLRVRVRVCVRVCCEGATFVVLLSGEVARHSSGPPLAAL